MGDCGHGGTDDTDVRSAGRAALDRLAGAIEGGKSLRPWRVAFEAVRAVKRAAGGGDPGPWRADVEAFFRRLGEDPADGWVEFRVKWGVVNVERDRFDEAWRAVVAAGDGRGDKVRAVAALAERLAAAGDGHFLLPVARVAEVLGVKRRGTAGAIINLLVADGVLKVEKEHCYTKAEARVFSLGRGGPGSPADGEDA